MLKLGVQLRGPITMEKIPKLKKYGVRAVEIGVESEKRDISALDRRWFFEERDLEPVTHLTTFLVHPHGKEMDKITEQVTKDIEISKNLEAKTVLCSAGYHPFLQKEAVVRLAIRTLCNIRGTLDDLDLNLALENHGYLDAREILEVVEAVDSPYVGVNLDAANAYQTEDDPVETAKMFAPHFMHAHIKDIALEDGVFKIKPMGTGMMEWEKILPILVGSKRDMVLAMEMAFYDGSDQDIENLIIHGLNYLRDRM